MTKVSTLLFLDGGWGWFEFIWAGIYSMCSILFAILDWLQGVFRALAGLEPITLNGEAINSGEETYDVVYYLIGSDLVIDIFVSMIIFSLILLVIMTFVALIRNTYQDKQKPVMDIIGKAFKGLLGFLLVPVACVVGLMVSGALLRAIDAGTSSNGSVKLSNMSFVAAAYDANGLRQEDFDDCLDNLEEICDDTNFEEDFDGVASYVSNMGSLTREEMDILADKLDDALCSGELRRNGESQGEGPSNPGFIFCCYVASDINYIVLIAGTGTLLGVMFTMCWGLIGRMFKLTMDFILIPVVLAMMPLDDGKAVGSWKGDFVKNLTMAFGVVGALNLYYSILPLVNTIELDQFGGLMNWVLKVMISIAGVFGAKNMVKTINGWFGTGDVIGEGESTWKSVKDGYKTMQDKAKKVSKKAGNTVGAYLGGVNAAGKAGKKGFAKYGSGFMAAVNSTESAKTFKEMSFANNVKAGKKTGKDAFKENYVRGGIIRDMFSSDTDNEDIRKGKLKALTANAKYAKLTKNMTAEEKEDFYLATNEAATIRQKGKVNIDGSVKSAADVERGIKRSEKEKSLQSEYSATINSNLSSISDFQNSFKEFSTLSGLNAEDVQDLYNKYKTGDPELQGYGLSADQIDIFATMKKAEDSAMSSSAEALIALQKSIPGLAEKITIKDNAGNDVSIGTASEKDIQSLDTNAMFEALLAQAGGAQKSGNNELGASATGLENAIKNLGREIKERTDKLDKAVVDAVIASGGKEDMDKANQKKLGED